MKACILGAGPSGLYVSQRLAELGIPVSIFEKESEILGNYKYARVKGSHFKNIVDTPGIELHLNNDTISGKDCSFYVVATGGSPRILDIPGGNLCVPAIDVVKKHYGGQLEYLGDSICIIGMGNVAMDVLNYIKDKCKKVLVLSPYSATKSPFDNHLLRELVEEKSWQISSIEGNDEGDGPTKFNSQEIIDDKHGPDASKRVAARRISILNKAIKNEEKKDTNTAKPLLRLQFNSKATKVGLTSDRKLEVSYLSGGKLFKEVFDQVIASVGFVPNKISVPTDRPVFYTGWCLDAKGNIEDARIAANICSQNIVQKMGIKPQPK